MTAALLLVLAPAHVLSLAEALQTADHNQPTLRQATAATDAARARAWEARAPLLPQLSGFATYQRRTANYTVQFGTNV